MTIKLLCSSISEQAILKDGQTVVLFDTELRAVWAEEVKSFNFTSLVFRTADRKYKVGQHYAMTFNECEAPPAAPAAEQPKG